MKATKYILLAVILGSWVPYSSPGQLPGERLAGQIIARGTTNLLTTPQPGSVSTQTLERIRRIALGWINLIVSNDYQPPPSAVFGFVPRAAEGQCDHVMVSYSIGNTNITIAQTVSMFVVDVQNENWKDAAMPGLPTLKAQFQSILRHSDGLELTISGADSGEIRLASFKAAPWLSRAGWKRSGKGIILWLLKDDGKPTSTDRGFDIESNELWFELGKKTK